MHPTTIHSLNLSLLLFIFLIFTVSFGFATLHQLLQTQGLPPGLFPDTVKSYSLQDSTGRLQVQLHHPCMAKFENRVYFETIIQANLSFGRLNGLVGMSQEELFLWLPVKDITVTDPSSGLILFDIGVALKQISISLFEDPPVCEPQGDLSDADDEKKKKKKKKKKVGFLSS